MTSVSSRKHQEFATGFFDAPWDATTWATVGARLLTERVPGGGPVTWVTETHDLKRTPSRYATADDDPTHPVRGAERARAALLAILGLPGGAYIYQGQELGLPEVEIAEEARADPAAETSTKCRDGARVPLPWSESAEGAFGFSPKESAEPWLPVPVDWGELSVQVQEADPGSTLYLCRQALLLRRRLHLAGLITPDDDVEWRVDPDGRLLACRDSFILAVAMGEVAVPLPPGDVLLASGPLDDEGLLPRDTAAWISARRDAG